MTWTLILFLFYAVNRTVCLYDSSSDVKSLGIQNFKKYIKRNRFTLVEFYAPWCGHCKSLKPEYEAAAKDLKGIVSLAAVDASNEKNADLATRYEVKGFPTMILFKDGKPNPFNSRSKDTIIKELKDALPDKYITILSVDNIEEFTSLKGPKLLHFGKEKQAEPLLKSLSHQFYRHLKFGYVPDSEKKLAEKFDVKKHPHVLLLDSKKSGDKKKLKFSPTELRKEISDLLGDKANDFENFNVLEDNSCLQKHCIKGGNLCVFYVESADKEENKRRLKILQEARDELNDETYLKFVKIDGVKNKEYLKELFGAKTILSFPRVFLVSYKKRLYSPFKTDFEQAKLTKFLNGFIENKNTGHKIHYFKAEKNPKMMKGKQVCYEEPKVVKEKKPVQEKKEPTPEKKEPTPEKKKPTPKKRRRDYVVKVTSKNLKDVIGNSRVPVIMKFYAEWCGHCMKLIAEYERAAEDLGGAVLFVEGDADNDPKLGRDYQIRGYPTLKVTESPANNKNRILFEPYRGGRVRNALAEAAKKLLAAETTAVVVKSDVKSFQDAFTKEVSGWKVFFVGDKKSVGHIVDGASIYFKSVKEAKFFLLPASHEMAIKMLNLHKEVKMFVLKHKKDHSYEIFQKKEIIFDDLVKDLQSLFDNDEKAISDVFSKIERNLVDRVKAEL